MACCIRSVGHRGREHGPQASVRVVDPTRAQHIGATAFGGHDCTTVHVAEFAHNVAVFVGSFRDGQCARRIVALQDYAAESIRGVARTGIIAGGCVGEPADGGSRSAGVPYFARAHCGFCYAAGRRLEGVYRPVVVARSVGRRHGFARGASHGVVLRA